MTETKNDDELFLTGLSDLYKLWQNAVVAGEDLAQDKNALEYLHGFSTDESYGKKAVRENYKNQVDKKSKLKQNYFKLKEQLGGLNENLQEVTEVFTRNTSKRKSFDSKMITILIVVGVLFFFEYVVLHSSSIFFNIVVLAIAARLIYKNRDKKGDLPTQEHDDKELSDATKERDDCENAISECEEGIEEVEAFILDKTEEYAQHRPVLIKELSTTVPKKTEVFNALSKNLNEFQDTDHRFPKEADFRYIPMIVEYWRRGYFDNMMDALNFCRQEERQSELINTLNVGFASVCASINNVGDSVVQGFNRMSIEIAHLDTSIQRQTSIVEEAAENIQELKEINREMASSLESCAHDTAQMRDYYAYKTEGFKSDKQIYKKVFR